MSDPEAPPRESVAKAAWIGVTDALSPVVRFVDLVGGHVILLMKALSWLLPVTYGVRLMRDVMLRGIPPADVDLIGLAATSVGFALLAWWLLARRLRVR